MTIRGIHYRIPAAAVHRARRPSQLDELQNDRVDIWFSNAIVPVFISTTMSWKLPELTIADSNLDALA